MALPLRFKRLSSQAVLPTRSYATDAGFDLTTWTSEGGPLKDFMWLEPGQTQVLSTHLAVDLPQHLWGLITGRSSTVRKHGLLVVPGVVDPGYTGELKVVVTNVYSEPVRVLDGIRMAQLVPMYNHNLLLNPVWGEIEGEGERGDNGFGSTGQ